MAMASRVLPGRGEGGVGVRRSPVVLARRASLHAPATFSRASGSAGAERDEGWIRCPEKWALGLPGSLASGHWSFVSPCFDNSHERHAPGGTQGWRWLLASCQDAVKGGCGDALESGGSHSPGLASPPAIFSRASGSLWADQSGLMAEPNTGSDGGAPSRNLVLSSRNPGSGFRNEKVNTGGGEGN